VSPETDQEHFAGGGGFIYAVPLVSDLVTVRRELDCFYRSHVSLKAYCLKANVSMWYLTLVTRSEKQTFPCTSWSMHV
jgi:hypothetical protein